ncbi:MAG: VWA domain-containing protein [Planctomycetota bacterium]
MNVLDLVVRPHWLPWLALAPVVAGVVFVARRREARRRGELFGVRRGGVLPRARARRVATVAALATSAALLAGAGPRAGDETATTTVGLDLVVALDVSRSMRAQDVAPDRLGRAQAEIAALGAELGSHRAALLAFAGEARLLVPLTRDGDTLARRALEADPTSVPVGGTRIATVLRAAAAALATRAHAEAALVLLTDGEDLGDHALDAARELAAGGVRVHAFALGSAQGARIPDGAGGFVKDAAGRDVLSRASFAALEALAGATGGTARAIDAGTPEGVLLDLRRDELDVRARRVERADAQDEPGEAWRLLLVLACFGGLWLLAGAGRAGR